MQLLAGLTAWRHLDSHRARNSRTESLLVLGDFHAGQVGVLLDEVCRDMAAAGGFARIVSTHDLDASFYQGASAFPDYLTQVLRRIGSRNVDEIFVCRNMQALNEAVLHGFPKARKVCFGDGLGVIDVNDGAPFFRPFLQSGYSQVDEIICVAPVEWTPGLFSHLPITTVPPDCFIQTVKFVLQYIESARWLTSWNGLRGAQNSVFVCLANLTEARLVGSIDEELEFYVSCVRPLVDRERTIIIKGHPRQQLRQAELLTSRLQAMGYQAHCAVNGHLTPVEFLALILPVSLLISLLSNSGLTWRLLRPETSILWGVPPDLIDGSFMPDTWGNDLSSVYTGLYSVFITLATQRSFPPVCRRAVQEHLNLLPCAPIRFPGEAEFEASSIEEKLKIHQVAEFVERVVRTSKEMFFPLSPQIRNTSVDNRVSDLCNAVISLFRH